MSTLASVVIYDVYSNLPAAGIPGRTFYVSGAGTNAGNGYYDDGTTWHLIVSPSAGGGGALVLVEEHTASTSAALDFTSSISATYDEYVIEIINAVPDTPTVDLIMQMSTDGGATYDTGSNYFWDGGSWRAGAGFGQGGGSDTSISLTAANGLTLSASTNFGVCYTLRLYNPLSTAVYKQVIGKGFMPFVTGPIRVMLELGGQYTSTTAVNAFRFLMTVGNILSGTIRVYGLTH